MNTSITLTQLHTLRTSSLSLIGDIKAVDSTFEQIVASLAEMGVVVQQRPDQSRISYLADCVQALTEEISKRTVASEKAKIDAQLNGQLGLSQPQPTKLSRFFGKLADLTA